MMPSELSSLYLFAFLIAKSGLMTGLLPGLFLAALVEAKYHRLMKWAWCYRDASAHELMLALIESVKLQSHYAMLLNMHDGGERLQFSCVADWIERLKKVGTIR